MEKNPFLHNNDNPEGSDRERFYVKHALRREHAEVPDENAEWERIRAMINLDAAGEETADETAPKPWWLRMSVWTVAAAIVLMAGAGLFYALTREPISSEIELYIADRSGRNEIVMTTPDGVATVMEPRKDVTVSRPETKWDNKAPGIVKLETPAGKELAVMLPDSTRILLWPNSRLEFPERFTGDVREVTLTGEAYFDVMHAAGKPFIVNTPYFSARVYGTEFGICAMGHEDASVTLVDGSLAVVPDGGSSADEVLLVPDQEATFADGGVMLTDVDTYPLRQWRDGMFYFEHESLYDILLALGRWYNVTVVVQTDIDLDEPYHFAADRNQPLDLVVDAFAEVSEIKMDFDGNQITVGAVK